MKNTIRKVAYLVIYGLIIIAFIHLGTKDYSTLNFANDKERFNYEYKEVPKNNKFEYLNSTEFITLLKEGNGIVFVGDKETEWSQRYAKYLHEIIESLNVDKIYYYDARRVKQLKNRNYYDIIEELEGNLIETDDSSNNLFTPSLYIIKKGNVIYHDSTTSVVNNEDNVNVYWTLDKEVDFKEKITQAILDNY